MNTFLNIRMVTSQKNGAIGDAFIKAPNDSAFGKVFLNNMDWNSFMDPISYNTKKQIAMMILNGKTALFDIHTRISESQEFRNCLVSKKIIHFLD